VGCDVGGGGDGLWGGGLGMAGLRGAMIGWDDGVFGAWGTTYFCNSAGS